MPPESTRALPSLSSAVTLSALRGLTKLASFRGATSPTSPCGLRRTSCFAIARANPAKARQCEAGWWGRQDSNLRSHEAADLQSAPFATRDTPPEPSQPKAIKHLARRATHLGLRRAVYGQEPPGSQSKWAMALKRRSNVSLYRGGRRQIRNSSPLDLRIRKPETASSQISAQPRQEDRSSGALL